MCENCFRPNSILTKKIDRSHIKHFFCFSSNILLRLESPGQSMVPYCPITVKSTREIAGFNGLAEALLRLDFIRAVSDIRRFHYVSHLMFLLFAHDKLSQLPGAAQKVLFRMLEEMANTGMYYALKK